MSTSAFQLRQLDRSSAQRQVAEAAPTSDAPPYSAFSAPGSENPSASTSQQHLTTLSSSEEEESAGWQAWVVVGAATVIFTCALGLVYSFGVTQQLLIERNFATASELGWVSTMSVIYVPLFALPMQMAVLRWGNRLVGVAGSILTSGGFFATAYCIGPTISTASSSAQRLAPIFVAQSVFGLGYGCLFWSATAIAAQWVSPRRTGFATGIVYAGSGLGGAVFSIALSKMAARIGLEASLRIYGGFTFALLFPSTLLLKTRGVTPGTKLTMHWRLAKDIKFIFLLIGTALVTFSLFVPPFFLPTYAASAGFSSDVGAWLVAGYNLSSAVGRVMFGMMADSLFGPVTTLLLCITLFGASILGVWVTAANQLAPLIVFILINGAAGGALWSLQPAVSASVWRGSGKGEMQSVMAMSTMGRIFGTLLGAPLAGYLLDAFGGAGFGTGAYRPALLVMGTISLLASSCLYGLRWAVVGFSLKKRVYSNMWENRLFHFSAPARLSIVTEQVECLILHV